ncbi:amine sulfotransferase-like [Thalassophryne amazonica]|uniref:amine sulfotransferase-like n=1 Tax=Thalassophryne amazonica TaxID=390379 RepID=UPI001470E880|nr:amine sulfotransferase-like [Thalassophryne amazonica]
MTENKMEPIDNYLCRYKNHIFLKSGVTAEYIDSLQTFKILDSDIFVVTYPKSGTIWSQQIIISICDLAGGLNEYSNNWEQMPWLEYTEGHEDYSLRPSPRLFTSHLIPALMPPGLKDKKAKIVYVMRNPKDIVTSFYHFCQIAIVITGSWFDHIRQWHATKDEYNILFLTYEEMVLDFLDKMPPQADKLTLPPTGQKQE